MIIILQVDIKLELGACLRVDLHGMLVAVLLCQGACAAGIW